MIVPKIGVSGHSNVGRASSKCLGTRLDSGCGSLIGEADTIGAWKGI